MALISAADYAKLPSSIEKEKQNFAYQAANPSTSSYKPQANDPNSAAYNGSSNNNNNYNPATAGLFSFDTSLNSKDVVRDAAGQVMGYKKADGSFVKEGLYKPGAGATNPSTNFLINGQSTGYPGAAAQQAPQTAVSSQTMNPATGQAYPAAQTGLNGNMGSMPGMYNGNFTPTPSTGAGAMPQAYTPPSPQYGIPSSGGRIDALTPQQKADIKAQLDARIAKQTTIANQTKQGFQTAFDRLSATTKDDRTLQDASFQRAANPFSGSTDYRASMMDRERERTDREGQQDLQSRLANVDLSLADYANATDAERVKMENDMLQQERSYGLQQDQLALQRQGQEFNQGVQTAGLTGQYNGQNTMQQNQNNFSNGIAYSGLTGYMPNGQRTLAGQGQDSSNTYQKDALALQKAGLTGYLGGQQTVAGRQADESIAANRAGITGNYTNPQVAEAQQKMAANSTTWFNASPEERTRLAAENQRLGASIGATQDGNGNWVMPQPQRTVAGQQLDIQKAQQDWDNTFKSGAFDYQKASDLWERTFKEKTFDEGVKQFAQNLGVDYARLTQQGQQMVAENAFKDRAQNWNESSVNPSNQDKTKPKAPETAETYAKYIDSNVARYQTDEDGNKVLSNPGEVEKAILASNLDDYEIYKLYLAKGFKWEGPPPSKK